MYKHLTTAFDAQGNLTYGQLYLALCLVLAIYITAGIISANHNTRKRTKKVT